MKKVLLFIGIVFVLLVVLSLALTLATQYVPGIGKVGLVKVEGVIISSKEASEQLKDYREDPSIKAVVLSVDSPVGAVVPSQEIYNEVKKTMLKKAVVVSMGSLAASGGYYISAPASKIIANEATLTGSIGVIMQLVNLQELFDNLGIQSVVIKSGRYKDIGSMYREMDPEERDILKNVLDDIHTQFIEAVAAGRKMPVDVVRNLADGRIYTGRQALEMGLVDACGTLSDAIKEAALLGGIKGEPQVVSKEKEFPLSEYLSNKLAGMLSGIFPPVRVSYQLKL